MLVFLLAIICAQDEAVPKPGWVAGIKAQLHENVGFELTRARRFYGLTESQSKEISGRLDGEIHRSARKYAVADGRNRPLVLDEELSAELAGELNRFIGEKAAGQWQQDVAKRRAFCRDAILDGAMVMLDYRVGFTAKQHQQVRLVLRDQWKLASYYHIGLMAKEMQPSNQTAQRSSLPVGFPEQAVLQLLNQSQKLAWKTHARRMADKILEQALPPVPIRIVEPLEDMRKLLKQRAHILAEHYKLGDSQKRKLEIAANGAAAAAFKTRTEALTAFNQKQRLSPVQWDACTVILPELVICQSPWREMARKALPKEVRQQFDRRNRQRAEFVQAAFAKYKVADLTSWRLMVSADGQQKLFQLFRDVPIDSSGVWQSSRRYLHWSRIPDEAWAETMVDAEVKWTTAYVDQMAAIVFPDSAP